jgi:hypothetical protein
MRTVDEVAPDSAREGSVRAVERALLVLEALSRRPEGATASEAPHGGARRGAGLGDAVRAD